MIGPISPALNETREERRVKNHGLGRQCVRQTAVTTASISVGMVGSTR